MFGLHGRSYDSKLESHSLYKHNRNTQKIYRLVYWCLLKKGQCKIISTKVPWPKLSQNSWKTSESNKTLENAFDKICGRLFFGKFLVGFWTIFGKLENQQKTLRK